MYPIAADLDHMEPANFALVQLFQTRILHRICADIKDKSITTSRNLVALLAHLFARRRLPKVYAQHGALTRLKSRKSPSSILLEPISVEVRDALITHNEQ